MSVLKKIVTTSVIASLFIFEPFQAGAAQSQAPALCSAIQKQIDQLKFGMNSQDWPKTLAIQGLSWPDWKRIDPLSRMDLIRRTIYWPRSREFYGNAWTDQQYDGTWGTQEQQELQWKNQVEFFIYKQIKNGLFSMQSADAKAQVGGRTVDVTMIRFRIFPSKFKNNFRNTTDINPLENWEYAIENISGFPGVHDLPISDGIVAVGGKVGILANQLLIFDTLDFPYSELDSVDILPTNPGWPTDPSWNKYKMVQLSAKCVMDLKSADG